MLTIYGVSKFFGERALFENASLNLNRGERIALFGKNGSGKSTLLKMICDEVAPDAGSISAPKGYRIGFLRQHLVFKAPSVIEEVCSVLGPDSQGEEYKGEILLTGLGFSDEDMLRSPADFSGGFQIRINLAKLLLSEPDLLLLDEPTNYLDIVSMRWLERFLREWKSELIVISHDRSFCDTVSTHSALIYRSGIRKIPGNSQKLFEQIAEDEEVYEKTRVSLDKQRKKMEAFINRFRAKASKATVVQSRVKALAKLGTMAELQEDEELDFSFTFAQFPGRFPIEITDLSFAYESQQPLVSALNLTVKKDDRIAFIGKNGRGKSTLLRLVAGELQPREGSIVQSPNTKLAFFAQTNVNRLQLDRTIEAEVWDANPDLRRTLVRNICGAMMFDGDDALKRIEVLSGGERSRVLLGRILATPSNVLLLDEPTNHLDAESVLALIDALEEFEGAVIIVTHNEEILRRVARRLVIFQGDAPFVFEGDYDDFLDRIGWEDEVGLKPSRRGNGAKASESPKNDSSERKRLKAELLQERSRTTAPLKKKVENAERRVGMLEAKISAAQTELVELSNRGDGAKIATVSKDLEKAKRELESAMNAWERDGAELSKVEGEFEAKLREFD